MIAVRHARFVGQLMTSDPAVVSVDTPLADVAALMDFYRVSGVPVIDGNGAVVGVVSQTDLLHVRADALLWPAWETIEVQNVMTRPAVTVLTSTTIADASRLMDDCGIHRLVVIDSDGETPIARADKRDPGRLRQRR